MSRTYSFCAFPYLYLFLEKGGHLVDKCYVNTWAFLNLVCRFSGFEVLESIFFATTGAPHDLPFTCCESLSQHG